MSRFLTRLASIARKNQSLVCVGLDPDPALMPIRDVLAFNKAIVDATRDLVCAFKPNLPFYEALGTEGLNALSDTVEHIRAVAPDVLLIGDGKRGDIASTNHMYARALFDFGEFDAAVGVTDHSNIDYDTLTNAVKLVVDTRNAIRDRPGTARIVRA